MASTQNSDKIGQPAKQIHAGINYIVARGSLTATASGTDTINLIHLPRGAKIQDIFVTTDVTDSGTGGESIVIKSSGAERTYMSATLAQCAVGARMGATVSMHAALGYVYTASDTLILQTGASAVGTGTASISFKVAVSYTVEDDQL